MPWPNILWPDILWPDIIWPDRILRAGKGPQPGADLLEPCAPLCQHLQKLRPQRVDLLVRNRRRLHLHSARSYPTRASAFSRTLAPLTPGA